MTENVTEDRASLQGVRQACDRLGIAYKAFSDNWVIRLEKAGTVQFIFAYGFSCNNKASADIAFDKVATSQLLTDRGVPCVPHYLLQTIDMSAPAMSILDRLISESGSVVVKPLEGSRGAYVGRFDGTSAAVDFVNHSKPDTWAAAPFVAIQRELRIVIFNGSVRLAYEKYNPQEQNNLKMFNLHLGAQARSVSNDALTDELRKLAIASMKAIGLALGAVDIVILADGSAQVLEINAAFSLEHYAALSDKNRQVVVNLYETIVEEMFT